MAWSIFQQGGGPGAAYTWAVDLLKKIQAPLTAGNEQMVYDWETSEGGGGKYNPLNQGPDPGRPALTSTGSQFGGGAADYVSWSAGIQGAADYLAMPNFSRIADDLRSNQPEAARADLIASPWAASHYNSGAGFSNAHLPGKASALSPAGGSPSDSGGAAPSTAGAIAGLTTDLKTAIVVVPLVLAGGALVVWGAGRMTGIKPSAARAAATTGGIL